MLMKLDRIGGKWVRHGDGQPPGKLPAYQEGDRLSLAWLYPDELVGAWVRYRPSRKGAVPVPKWVHEPINEMNDFLLIDYPLAGMDPLHMSILGIRGHLIALTGMDPVPEKFDNWGVVRYTTIFVETSEARTRLTPKYVKLRPNAWDRVVADE